MIFNTNSLPFDGAFTDQDKKVSRNLLELWTNFTKLGQNGPEWTPLKVDNQQRLAISSKGPDMISLDENLVQFWNDEIWPKILADSEKSEHKTKLYQMHNYPQTSDKDEL